MHLSLLFTLLALLLTTLEWLHCSTRDTTAINAFAPNVSTSGYMLYTVIPHGSEGVNHQLMEAVFHGNVRVSLQQTVATRITKLVLSIEHIIARCN